MPRESVSYWKDAVTLGCSELKQEMRSRWRIRDLASYMYIYIFIYRIKSIRWKFTTYQSVEKIIRDPKQHWTIVTKLPWLCWFSMIISTFFESCSVRLNKSPGNHRVYAPRCASFAVLHFLSPSLPILLGFPPNAFTNFQVIKWMSTSLEMSKHPQLWTKYWLFSKNFERLLWSLTWLELEDLRCCHIFSIIAMKHRHICNHSFKRGPEVVVNFLLELYSSPTLFAWQPKNSLKTSTEYSFP